MSCAGTSFMQRHLCFRVTTSLLTVLPQLAYLALLQVCIIFFTCMNPTAPPASWPDVTGHFSCQEKTFCAFASLLFCLPDSPLAPFPSSSPLPLNYWPSVDVMLQDFSGLFCLLEKEHVQSSLDLFFTVTSQSLGQSMQEESTCGDKGQHPTASKEHVWLCCDTKLLFCYSLHLKLCTVFFMFLIVISSSC